MAQAKICTHLTCINFILKPDLAPFMLSNTDPVKSSLKQGEEMRKYNDVQNSYTNISSNTVFSLPRSYQRHNKSHHEQHPLPSS